MSQTILYVAPKDGTFSEVASFPNAWGGAMFIWTQLGEKYFGNKCYVMTNADKFWPIWKDKRLSEAERVAMLSTFDACLVLVSDAARLAGSFRQFVKEHPSTGVVCSLQVQAVVFDKIATGMMEFDFVPYALGWTQTSVSGSLWDRPIDQTEENEGRPYNLAVDKKHFFLFEELEREFPRDDL